MRIALFGRIGIIALAILALPALAGCGGEDAGPDPTATSAIDSGSAEAPQAEDVDLAPEIGTIDNWYNGGATTLAELRGTPVLLVFWADY